MVLEWQGSREVSRTAVVEAEVEVAVVAVEGAVLEALHEGVDRAEVGADVVAGADAVAEAEACTAVVQHAARHMEVGVVLDRPVAGCLCRAQAPAAVETLPQLAPVSAECYSRERRRVHGTLYRRKSVFSARWARDLRRFL